jgi:hypothetical protein
MVNATGFLVARQHLSVQSRAYVPLAASLRHG